MVQQTYKYFQPDTNLRSDYGGGAIVNNGDSAEVLPADLTERYVSVQIGWPSNGVQYPWVRGEDGSSNVWIKVSDNLYSGISSYLSTTELASVQSTAPSGFVRRSKFTAFQPHPSKNTLFVRGDSISAGLGTTSGDPTEVAFAQALELMGQNLSYEDTANRQANGDTWRYLNVSLGGSSWGNTVAEGNTGGAATYPLREDLAFVQRIQTLALNTNSIFIYWLGTNDIAYDVSQSATNVWARTTTRLSAFRSQFPTIRLALCSLIKRGQTTALNTRISDFNTLLRANYLSAGADALIDFEANVPQVNIITGDTTDTTYYTDGVHLTTAGHALLAPIIQTVLEGLA